MQDVVQNFEAAAPISSGTENIQQESHSPGQPPEHDSPSMIFDFDAASQDQLPSNSDSLFSTAALNDLELNTDFLNLSTFHHEPSIGSLAPTSSTKMDPRKRLAIEILNNTGFDAIFSASSLPKADSFGNHALTIANRLTGDYDLNSTREWLAHPAVTLKKNYVADKCSTIMFNRILYSYPRMLATGSRAPPMFHHSQLAPHSIREPMSNCITIARMWYSQKEPSKLAVETLRREMNRLFSEFETYTEPDLLATLQALLLYTIMALLAPSGHLHQRSIITSATLTGLQQVACRLVTTGLLCPEEKTHTRPPWPAWILMAAKRRAMFILYALEAMFNTLHDLPTYMHIEIVTLIAPAGKVLWEASTEAVWTKAYNQWLAKWTDGPFLLGEIMGKRIEGEERMQMWIEDVDDFGMMVLNMAEAGRRAILQLWNGPS